MDKYKVAVIQLNSGENKEENLIEIDKYLCEAAKNGAKLAALPESSNYCGKNVIDMAEDIENSKSLLFFKEAAKKYNIYIHCGTIYVNKNSSKKPYNMSFLIDPKGEVLAQYAKIHPFDVTVENGPDVRESQRITKGDSIIIYETKDMGTFGFSVCYDIRFPELFRLMALKGTEVFFTPADFTYKTGQAHWEVILRARAIENGCYVIAPCQTGVKAEYRSNGNSMIISPWGDIIAKAEDEPCIIYGEIDIEYLKSVRKQINMFENRRVDIYNLF